MTSFKIIIQTCEITYIHQPAILRGNLKRVQKGTMHWLLRKIKKVESLRCLFKIEDAKHKTLDLSTAYILTTPKFI